MDNYKYLQNKTIDFYDIDDFSVYGNKAKSYKKNKKIKRRYSRRKLKEELNKEVDK